MSEKAGHGSGELPRRLASEPGAQADTSLAPGEPGGSEPSAQETSPAPAQVVSAVSPRAHSPLARSITSDAVSAPVPSFDLDRLPVVDRSHYEFLGEVGRGGLGRVLKAFDQRLNRVVAVKEMLVGGGGGVSRFVREAIATAGLEHPAVIPVHEAGRWPTGEPFCAMKFVSGRSLAAVIEELPTLAHRLALLPNVIAVADAMAYAHSKRLIHRDLKPANVLVGPFGETVIIDWGIAKTLADGPPSSRTGVAVAGEPGGLTVAGAVLGTPAYMPPEQAAGGAVDERSDVYALGAILYQVLAGRAPYDASQDMMQRVLAGEPVPLQQRQPGIAAELLTIVNKAMARDPRDRYPSAKELADDLRRFQTGQLVTSHQYTLWSLARRWLHRHRLLVALSATLLLALAVVGGVSIHRVIRARVVAEAALRQAESATRVAQSRANALLLMRASSLLEVDPTATLAVLKSYPLDAADWDAVGTLATDAWSRGIAHRVLRSRGEFLNVAFSPDGRWIAAGGADKLVYLWDVRTGAVRRLAGHEGEVTWVAMSADSRWIVSAGRLDKRIWVWDASTGEGHALVGHQEGVRCIALSDGETLVSTSFDKTLRVWNVVTGAGHVVAHTQELDQGSRCAVSPDGRLAVYGGIGSLRAFDVASGAAYPLAQSNVGTGAIAFSRDGRTLASGGMDTNVRVWDLARGSVQIFRGHTAWVSRVAFSPDGTALVTAASDGTARLWNIGTGEGPVLLGAAGDISAAVFSPDGSHVAMAADDRLIRLWEVRSLSLRILRGHAAQISGIAFSADGRTLASSSHDKTVRAWDLAAGDLRVLSAPAGATRGLTFSGDGETLAFAHATGKAAAIVLANARTGELRTLDGPNLQATYSALAPDAKHIVVGEAQGGVNLLATAGGGARLLGRHDGDVYCCAYAPDGTRVATGGVDKTVRVWDTTTGEGRIVGRHDGTVYSVAFSSDGRSLVSGGTDRTVRVWDLQSGAQRVLRGHEGWVEEVAFSSDGARVGSVSMDGTLRIWDLATGNARVFSGDQLSARTFSFSRDDLFALVGETRGAVREWDLTTGQSRVVRRHGSAVRLVRIAADGRTVASAGTDGSTWLWDLGAVPGFSRDPLMLRAWMNEVTTAELNADGEVGSAP